MPHLVLLYTPDLESEVDVPTLCRDLADTMIVQLDENQKPVFPKGGTRVLAYPAAHSAVADGKGPYGFFYANLRMANGRSALVHKQVGDALLEVFKKHLEPVQARRPVGLTVQVDESHSQVYDAKHSTLHPLFNK